jgi:dolichol-phosphate mannosyltransferase
MSIGAKITGRGFKLTENRIKHVSNGSSNGHVDADLFVVGNGNLFGVGNGNSSHVQGADSNGRVPNQLDHRLSVIIPTRNEAANVGPLLDWLEAVLPERSEIVFVDDSTDETPELVIGERSRRSTPITLIHRPEGERGDGLAGAVATGLRVASAPWVCVMDADLQHPPDLIGEMLTRAEAGGVDVVIASRYCGEGACSSFRAGRALLSRASTRAARLLFPRSLRGVSDPMSGFFLVRRTAVDVSLLRPRGFKILLEILVRSRTLRVAEVPFQFGTRYAGESKASLKEGGRYVSQLASLRFGGRLGRFALVGLSGLAVNSAAFFFFASILHVHYLLAAVLSTQFSTVWNFVLTERWVFERQRRRMGSAVSRFWAFFAVNNLSLLLRGPMLYAFVSLGMNSLLANLVTLVTIFAIRFAIADVVIWGKSDRDAAALYWYRIHDEVTVESPVRLPELERFRVDTPVEQPTIRVRLGRLTRKQSSLVSDLMSAIRHIRYDEGLGRLGFAVDIAWGKTVDIVAAPILRFSPHVLYTNVVEPTLRWCFVTRGYALAHCACVSVDGRAHLITAKTDTGKTTTILKLLDRYPASFLSDDLTLIAKDGRVLMYPKPLTISRHTVASVKTPLLTARERFALIFQSRVHSRSGRQFAQLIARLRLPAATINSYVQMTIPPPKYQIERLVPDVHVVPEATVAGFVVIERSAESDIRLSPNEAVDVLVANSEDAYGFPPYPALANFMHSRNGRDLRIAERQILAGALAQVDAVVLRSDSMDWWERVASLAGLSGSERTAADRFQEGMGTQGAVETALSAAAE